MHKDKEEKPLKEGFYREHSLFGLPLYFTGKYNAHGNAIIEDHDGLSSYSISQTSKLLPNENIDVSFRVYTDFKGRITRNLQWIEEKRNQLEQLAKEGNLSAQKLPNDEEEYAARAKRDLPGLLQKGIDSIPGGNGPYIPDEDDIPF